MGCEPSTELSILITDDARIAQLNERYLGRTGSTNVLAFPMAGGEDPGPYSAMLGDVVISVDTAMREASEADEPCARTVYRLLCHGLLHLMGYDHEVSDREAERMEREEERLVRVMERESI